MYVIPFTALSRTMFFKVHFLFTLQRDFEKLHEFKMFLRHLEKRGVASYEEHGEMIIGIANGEIQGHLVFSKFDKVDLSASYFENGAFLSIGHVGCHSEVSARFYFEPNTVYLRKENTTAAKCNNINSYKLIQSIFT